MWKRNVSLIVAAAFLLATLTACQPTAAMIQAEVEFYKAQVEISKGRSGGNPVLLEIKAQNPERDMVFQNVASITVFAPPSKEDVVGPVQYRQVDYSAPWVSVAGGILGMATIAAGGVYLARELKGFGGNVNYNAMGQGSSIKTQGASSANISGGTVGGHVGTVDATSTPTVVEQPAPIVVTPEPVIVTQPEPVIVK